MGEQATKQERHDDEEVTGTIGDTALKGAAKTEGIDEDVDTILDEIDDVHETNAEDFVKSFVQKGGQ